MCPNIQSAGILRDRKNNSGIFGMKIEEAFSLEFGENIDVETAYDLFWARIITDKRKFVCCYEGCNAAVTAANLDRLRQDMAVDPHYRDVAPEDHITGCPNSKEAQANSAKNVSEEQNRQSRRISSAMADVFEFNRPDSHFVRTKSTKVQNSLEEPAKKKTRKKSASTANSAPRPSTHYSLRSFVSKYFRHLKSNQADEKCISVKGYNVPYSQMFVKIAGQSLDDLSEYRRIYYAKAFINKFESGDYSVRFGEPLLFNNIPIKPTLFISKKMVENAFSRQLYEEKLEELSLRKYPSVWVFIYSKPSPKQAKNSSEKTYINFSVDNMDLFDFREDIKLPSD